MAFDDDDDDDDKKKTPTLHFTAHAGHHAHNTYSLCLSSRHLAKPSHEETDE